MFALETSYKRSVFRCHIWVIVKVSGILVGMTSIVQRMLVEFCKFVFLRYCSEG